MDPIKAKSLRKKTFALQKLGPNKVKEGRTERAGLKKKTCGRSTAEARATYCRREDEYLFDTA